MKNKYVTIDEFEELSKEVDRLLLKVWILENPPKFKEGDIVVTVDCEQNISTYEYRILAFKEAKRIKISGDYHPYCNVYCAIDTQSENTNCIELTDGLNYILKLKEKS